VVKYHLRRGVGLIKFLENGTRPQLPTSRFLATSLDDMHTRIHIYIYTVYVT